MCCVRVGLSPSHSTSATEADIGRDLALAKSAYTRSRNRGHTLSPLQSGVTGRKVLCQWASRPPPGARRSAGSNRRTRSQPLWLAWGAEQRGHTRADRYKVPDFALQTAIRGLTSASCAHQLRKSGLSTRHSPPTGSTCSASVLLSSASNSSRAPTRRDRSSAASPAPLIALPPFKCPGIWHKSTVTRPAYGATLPPAPQRDVLRRLAEEAR